MSRSAARARTGHDRTSLYSEITDKIIAELEAGRVPWVQPWGTRRPRRRSPCRRTRRPQRRYSGVNVLILWGAVIERGFAAQSWLTFRQALSLGGNVRKGEHGTTVVYADRFIPDDERHGRSTTATSPARSRSSNDSRCSTPISARICPTNWSPRRRPCPSLILPAGRGADRRDRRRLPHRRRPRLLQPGADYVQVPPARRLFRADQLASDRPARARSLGRPSLPPGPRPVRHLRLGDVRQGRIGRRNDQRFRCASLGIVPTVRHADYLGSWLEVLREDNRAIVRAAVRPPRRPTTCSPSVPKPMKMSMPRRSLANGRPPDDLRRASLVRFEVADIYERKRADGDFVTGWKPRESLSAPVAENSTWQPPSRRSPSAPRATFPSTSSF